MLIVTRFARISLSASIRLVLALGFASGCESRHVHVTSPANISPELMNRSRADFAKTQLRTLHDHGYGPADSAGWDAHERAIIAAVRPVMLSSYGPRTNEILPLYQVSAGAGDF